MASSTESKAKPNILGMVVPSSCPPELQVCKSTGGVRDRFGKFLEGYCLLRSDSVPLVFSGQSSLLASNLAASTKIVVPPEFHPDIIAGLTMRLTAHRVPTDQLKREEAVLTALKG